MVREIGVHISASVLSCASSWGSYNCFAVFSHSSTGQGSLSGETVICDTQDSVLSKVPQVARLSSVTLRLCPIYFWSSHTVDIQQTQIIYLGGKKAAVF